jgi:hypothetical protein
MSEAATVEWSVKWQRRLCSRYCLKHDLIREFLPFGVRGYDNLDIHRSLREVVDALPETRAVFTIRDFVDDLDLTAKELSRSLDTHLYALGAWPANGRFPGQRSKWVNPGYVHARGFASITEDEERREYFEAVARLGLIPQHALQHAIGVQTLRGVSHATDSCGIDYVALQKAGQRRLARTWKATRAYSDVTAPDLATIFDVPEGTVRGWLHRHAGDWTVPPHPLEEGSTDG